MEKDNLESAMRHFKETCERCNSKLEIHGLRSKSPGKRRIIYCHCPNKACGKYQMEIGFYGG